MNSFSTDYVILGALVGVLALLWNLHRDVAYLRESMARLEGLFEGFTRRDNRESAQ